MIGMRGARNWEKNIEFLRKFKNSKRPMSVCIEFVIKKCMDEIDEEKCLLFVK